MFNEMNLNKLKDLREKGVEFIKACTQDGQEYIINVPALIEWAEEEINYNYNVWDKTRRAILGF
jgi:hypothetical protein